MGTRLRPDDWRAIPVTRGLPAFAKAAARPPKRFARRRKAPSDIIAAAILLIATVLPAPRPQAQAPAGNAGFEVASVKPNKTGGPFPFGRIGLLPGGRFTGIGATLGELIRAAYGLREDAQISGGPNWVSTERFDIEAKAPADASPAQVQATLKLLLADRFKLASHTESRQLPLYALVLARSDGRWARGSAGRAPSARRSPFRRSSGQPLRLRPRRRQELRGSWWLARRCAVDRC